MARRKYTLEFKQSAVQLVNQQGYSPSQAAKSLGVDRQSVVQWIQQFSCEPELAVGSEGALQAELRCLR